MARHSRRPSAAVLIPASAPPAPAPVDYANPAAVIRTWVTVPAWKPLVNSRPSDWAILAGLAFVSTAAIFAVITFGAAIYALVAILHTAGVPQP